MKSKRKADFEEKYAALSAEEDMDERAFVHDERLRYSEIIARIETGKYRFEVKRDCYYAYCFSEMKLKKLPCGHAVNYISHSRHCTAALADLTGLTCLFCEEKDKVFG